MKSIVVRLAVIVIAILTMLIAFVAVAQADSPPNRCGLLPCEPVQCVAGTGDECKGPKLLVATPTPYPPCQYDPDGNGICDPRPTPTSPPIEAQLFHRLLVPVERIVKPLR